MRTILLLVTAAILSAGDSPPPALVRLHPLGGKAGTAVQVEILGSRLETATGVEFDCADLIWKQTIQREAGRLTGIVWIEPGAALGGHMLHVRTAQGPSTSLLFNVGQYPAVVESDHRSVPSLPAEIYGRLDGAIDSDLYYFPVKQGERWLFDLRAMEHGSAVEARMILVNHNGERVAFNDDRDHYNENPLIEHTFAEAGIYGVKLDQYRGPRGFTFGKNNGYTLRISALPIIQSIDPLGARRGSQLRLRIDGRAMGSVHRVYLTELRRGEYARMTYPYTMPIHFRPDPPQAAAVSRIEGRILAKTETLIEAAFAIPADAPTGLWRLWTAGPAGVAEGPKLEIGEHPEFAESAIPTQLPSAYTINGQLSKPKERDVYRIAGKAGQPIHVWTLSTQLEAPYLDTVLTLRNLEGKKLAEDDDVVAGWGGLLGNPDSSLFYTPNEDGPLLLEVRDRVNRGGPAYSYRLKFDHRRPGFQLFTTPENFTVKAGSTATLKVHLVREAGFQGEVDVWIEGLPGNPPITAKFRGDHVFEPNADGADMVIPEISFSIAAPPTSGTHPIRILGKAADGSRAEAHTATMIGPIYQGDWNFYRRPVPAITVTTVE
ncbi:MAG: hypothetical protein JST93_02320 [Acidobacteria bacterium]|nr:hypothetical protein [Acidobacteriota bacterium]